jgi:hypothetical protein
MARLIKNPRTTEASALTQRIPRGPTNNEPVPSTAGSLRYDTTSDYMRVYDGTAWRNLRTTEPVLVHRNSFTGDGVASSFGPVVDSNIDPVVLIPGFESSYLVFIDSVYQTPLVAYTFNNTSTISFTGIPDEFAEITVLVGLNY